MLLGLKKSPSPTPALPSHHWIGAGLSSGSKRRRDILGCGELVLWVGAGAWCQGWVLPGEPWPMGTCSALDPLPLV